MGRGTIIGLTVMVMMVAIFLPMIILGAPMQPHGQNFRSKVECIAYDIASRYDFNFVKGLVFTLFAKDLGFSFDILFCDHVDIMEGNIANVDLRADRYSTSVQGILDEFLIERWFGIDQTTGKEYRQDDSRTWDDNNVVKFRMLLGRGSNGPPCHTELDRTINGALKESVGRRAQMNIYCGGCPEWPANWTIDADTGKETLPDSVGRQSALKAVCSKYGVAGIAAETDLFTRMPTLKRNGDACVCGIGPTEPGKPECSYEFNITTTCPSAEKGFNEVKRLNALLAFSAFVALIGIAVLLHQQRNKTKRTGKQSSVLSRMTGAGSVMSSNAQALQKITSSVNCCSGADVIPPPPHRKN